MSSFPILHVPYVALFEISKHMGIMELIELSRASRRMSRRINLRNRFQLTFQMTSHDSTSVITIESKNEIFKINVIPESSKAGKKFVSEGIENKMRFEKETVPAVLKSPLILNTLWKDCIEGTFVMVSHLMNIFGCKLNGIKLFFPFPTIVKRVTDWMKIRKFSEIEKFSILNFKTEEKELEEFLGKIKVREHLILDTLIQRSNLKMLIEIPKEMKLKSSKWTLNDLSSFEFEKLCLTNTEFENEDFDFLVRKWVSGGFPRLKHLVITSSDIDKRSEVYGVIPNELMMRRNGQIEWIGDSGYDVTDGVLIQRVDGMKASLVVNTRYFSLLVHD